MLVYAHVFVYCRQDNDIMLASYNRVSRLIGPSDASPNVTRLSGIYCIFTAFLLDFQQETYSVGKKPAILLLVSFGKTLNGLSALLRDR